MLKNYKDETQVTAEASGFHAFTRAMTQTGTQLPTGSNAECVPSLRCVVAPRKRLQLFLQCPNGGSSPVMDCVLFRLIPA